MRPLDPSVLATLERYGIGLSAARPHGPATEHYLRELLAILEADPDGAYLLTAGSTTAAA